LILSLGLSSKLCEGLAHSTEQSSNSIQVRIYEVFPLVRSEELQHTRAKQRQIPVTVEVTQRRQPLHPLTTPGVGRKKLERDLRQTLGEDRLGFSSHVGRMTGGARRENQGELTAAPVDTGVCVCVCV
jgi:hypothetical protein